MPELRVICDKIEQQVAQTREKATARQWANISRPAFVNTLANITPDLEELHSLFQVARHEIEKSQLGQKPDIAAHAKELGQLITVLKRNRQMEEEHIDAKRVEGIQAIAETVTVPELYSDLEQKTLSMLLKSTYAAERMRVFDRKQVPEMQSKGAQKNILELLDRKESELEDLRQKYEETRRQTFLGLAEKESSAEIEEELNEIARRLEAKTAVLRKQFEGASESIGQAQMKISELEERLLGVEELESQVMGRTFELMTLLKKERDYAKKVLIEIEQETIQLRNTYSKELLGLHEEKLTLKNSMEDRFAREISEMKREIAAKNETISHLQSLHSSREKKIARLEEEYDKMKLINKALHKHETIKRHFAGKKQRKWK